MKLPVGYGGVSKIGGTKKRRNPWRARVTDRWEFDEAKGRAVQKFRVIGYFPTKKEALQALADFHKLPVAPGTADVTFADIFEIWRARNEDKMIRPVFTGYRKAFMASKAVHKMRMHDIRTHHLQPIMDDYENGVGSQRKLKTLWRRLFRLAIELDIVQKDYAEFVNLRGDDDAQETGRRPFSKEEIKLLWDRVHDFPGVDVVLIMIYTGVRPSELLSIDADKVHLSERWIELHGTKTKAARRAVPIHQAIVPLIERRLGENHLLEMPDDGRRVKYSHFLRRFWTPVVDGLRLEGLTPHSCRHTAVSLMVDAGVDDRLLKKIVGHSSGTTTGDVYTHAYLESLIREIDRVPMPGQ